MSFIRPVSKVIKKENILPTNPTDVTLIAQQIIPHQIYDYVITRNRQQLVLFFYNNPQNITTFLGFVSRLYLAGQYLKAGKCCCFFVVPWVTEYGYTNGLTNTVLTYAQQVALYYYFMKNISYKGNINDITYLMSIILYVNRIVINI